MGAASLRVGGGSPSSPLPTRAGFRAAVIPRFAARAAFCSSVSGAEFPQFVARVGGPGHSGPAHSGPGGSPSAHSFTADRLWHKDPQDYVGRNETVYPATADL